MGADGFEELRSVLSQTKLTALAKDQKVVTLKDSVTVEDALRILAHHRILSAPVLRATPPGSEVASAAGGVPDASSPIVGFVDIRDILSSFLKGSVMFVNGAGPALGLARFKARSCLRPGG
ncbi:hypothetical protein H632_c3181p0 [Helicosporidium sp. ATCC 50920]|nr:hypothetical protein H632_c3181p0 [Helicosporidium sp. ATCC 50920]|eukprot:KDD72571.1 hypothetical protein H632_c3181p0 [Helicosporidium sp. ATCC 50920]